MRRLHYVAVGITAPALYAACLTFFAVDVEGFTSNPRLRPDLAPLDPSQMPPTPNPHDPRYFASIEEAQVTFDDGGPAGDQLVTPSVPDMTNVAAARGSARGLLRGRCYWLGSRDALDLRWELVQRFEAARGHPDDIRVGACYPYIRSLQGDQGPLTGFEPLTRRSPLDPDTGEPVPIPSYLPWTNEPVALERVRLSPEFPAPDEEQCFLPGGSTAVHADEIDVRHCVFPRNQQVCNPWGCQVTALANPPASDGSTAHDLAFRLSLWTPSQVTIDTSGEVTVSDLGELGSVGLYAPTYRVVETSRVFRARLQLDVSTSLQRDELVYRWRMPTELVDRVARPIANFHPSLESTTRFIVQRAGRRIQVAPKHVRAVDPYSQRDMVDCRPDLRATRTHDRLRACSNGVTHDRLTPVARQKALRAGELPLEWEVTFDFKDDPLAFGPGPYGEELEAPDGELFMEFTIYESQFVDTSADAFRVTPSRLQFGPSRMSGTKTTSGWFENLTGNGITITGARFDDGSKFSLAPIAFPHVLGPRESLPFEVSVSPGAGANGDLQDMLHFDVRFGASSAPVTTTRSVRLTAEAVVGAVADLAPSSLTLWIQPGEATENQRSTRAVLIANVGTDPFERAPVGFVGADAAAFSVAPASIQPEDDPAIPAQLLPGTSSTFLVSFQPLHPGEHRATLRILSDAENGPVHDIELSGFAP